MDTRAPFDDPGRPTNPGSLSPTPIPPEIERRLAAIEDRLDTIDASLRSEIAQDLQAVSEEMRRAVSELGRLLLRDLDRLTRVLGEHRDSIVERLMAVEPMAGAEPAPAPVDDDIDEAASAPVETQALTGEEGRWRIPVRRRRRSPKPPPHGDNGES